MLSWAALAALATADLHDDGFSWLSLSVLVVAAIIFGGWFALMIRGIRAKRPEPVTLSIVVSILWMLLCIAQITLNVAYLRRNGSSWNHLAAVAGYSALLGAWATTGVRDFMDRRANAD